MRETRSEMARAVAVVAAMMVGCMPVGSDGGAVAMWGRREGVLEVSGDVLHLHAGQAISFCAEISDGSLIAWSYLSRFPGTTNKVAEGLDSNVVSFREALDYNAVLLKNGSVTAWDRFAKTPIRVENMQANVSSLHSTVSSHAALKLDGSISHLIPDNLNIVEAPEIANAQKIVQNVFAYTILLDNGEVFTWSPISARFSLKGVDFPGPVKDVFASNAAFAAVTVNNEIVAWTNQSQDARVTLTGEISQLLDTECGFLAVNSDGVGVVWPPLSNGIPISTVDFRAGVESVHVFAKSCESYAAILKDKSVVTWGLYGGNSSNADLSGGVESIAASRRAFAALKTDGSVVSWGDPHFGGDDSKVDFSGGVTTIKGINAAFAALKRDGTVVAWGNETDGGNVSAIDQSGGVSELVSNSDTFVVALLRSASPTVSPTLPTPYPTVPLPETGGFLSPEVTKALFIASMSLGAILVLSKLCSSCGKRTTSTETDEIVTVDNVVKP